MCWEMHCFPCNTKFFLNLVKSIYYKSWMMCVWFDLHYDSGGIPCGAMLSAPSPLVTC